jgi:hypothetical protein
LGIQRALPGEPGGAPLACEYGAGDIACDDSDVWGRAILAPHRWIPHCTGLRNEWRPPSVREDAVRTVHAGATANLVLLDADGSSARVGMTMEKRVAITRRMTADR